MGEILTSSFMHHERLIEVIAPIDIPLSFYRLDFWAKIRCKVRLIEKYIPIHEIDVIHAATLFTEGCTARALQKKYSIPFFVSVRGTDLSFYAKKMLHLWSMSRGVIKYANAMAFVTPSIKCRMMSRWQYCNLRDKLEKGLIINNGVDSIWTDNLCVEPKTIGNPVRILYIGRFDSNKNVMRLIDAVKGIRKSQAVRLTLIGGDGEEQAQVEQEVENHPDFIEYLGKIYDKQKLMQIVRECDIFAMVSHGETFGLVYAECLSQGLPIVYTLGTGFDGMYPQGKIGYGVDSHSVNNIKKGVQSVIDNYDKLRNNISEIDFKRFSWHEIAYIYIYIYESIKKHRDSKNGLRGYVKDTYYRVQNFMRWPSDKFNHNQIDSSCHLASGSSFKFCKIGKNNYIARRNSLYNVEVGNYCCFGPEVHIGGMQHSYWWYSMSPLLSDECKAPERTVIGNDVWIGAQVVIKQGVKIGDGAVIGANSFVNKDVEPFSIFVGSPAKRIKYRFEEEVRKEITDSKYWDKEPQDAKQILKSLKTL
ncbi:MAG: glycosyltransferase [Prevotella sp.]|nr:glycosyltransferase [Prevotella sp.]